MYSRDLEILPLLKEVCVRWLETQLKKDYSQLIFPEISFLGAKKGDFKIVSDNNEKLGCTDDA